MAGIPEISIKLREVAKAKNVATSSGTVLLLLKGKKAANFTVVRDSDIPSDLEENNKKLVLDALKGGLNDEVVNGYVLPVALTPQKVLVKVVTNETTVANALEECKNIDFTVLAVPPAVQADNASIVSFIDYMYESGYGCMAVIKDAATTTKNRNIVRYNTKAEGYDSGGSTSELSARIAGVIAGVPLNQATTYQIMDDIKVIDKLTRAEIDTKVKAGELVIANISGHTRIVSGVTSYVPENPEKESPFSKIKLVLGYNFINNAVKDVIANNYVGKVQNSYANKVSLCVTIKTDLLDKLNFVDGEKNGAEIDTSAQKAYLKTQGVDVDSMTPEEINKHKTNDRVFINLFADVYDAMENFRINMNIEN